MIPVAFDLRDPDRSGIARVARSLARAFAQLPDADSRFALTLCGPVDRLQDLGAGSWGHRPLPMVNWTAGRHSLASQLPWMWVRARTRNALWFFSHWDVPWYDLPNRYVVMVHDLTLLRIPGATRPARRWLAERWIRRAVRHAARVVVPSHSTARDLAEFAPSDAHKIRRIPEGVDPAFFGPAPALPRAVADFAGGAPFMLSVGNRKRHKNLHMGVEVLRRIPEVRWVVVGERFPEWDEVLAHAAGSGVAHRLLVLDTQPDQVLHALYGAAACLLFPSRYEGFGLPVAEAIACGTPVVCSNAGSLAEVADQCAALCDPDDVSAFTAAVREVLANPRRQPPGCVERVRGMSWAASAQGLAGVLAEVEA